MSCEAQLAGRPISKMTYKPSKLGQSDLVSGCDQSSSFSRSVHARLRVSTCYDFHIATLVNTQTDSFDRLYIQLLISATK